MARTAAPGPSRGGGDGGRPPRRPDPAKLPLPLTEEEDEEQGVEEEIDEEPVGYRVQCLACKRWIRRTVGLERHSPRCVGDRGFRGNFACTYRGCGARRSFYHDLVRHYRNAHSKRIPLAIRNYVP